MTRFYHNYSSFFRLNSVSNNIPLLLHPAVFLLAIIILISCEEGATKMGSDLLPGDDYVTISSLDTLSVWSYSMYDNVVPTNDPLEAFIGNILDPYFGTTTTEFVSQLRLSSAWSFGPVTIDSVKLNLKLLVVKGGSPDQGHFIRLSEIADQIFPDKVYYSNTTTDTTIFETIVQLPTLRSDTINNISVSLPVEFGEYLTRDTTQLFYSNTKPDFRSFFKGLYFRISSANEPLIVSFSTVSQVQSGGEYNNYFVIFMHDTANISRRYFFILDAVHPNACYNKFTRDFSTADDDKRIAHINDLTYRDTLTYLQYLNGIYTKIIFPGLDSLKKEFANHRISINKARLRIPVYYDQDLYTVLTVPASLRLRYQANDSVKLDVPDYELDVNNSFFDGTLHKLDSTYYFNIPTYIQNYLEDKTNKLKPELELYQGPTGLQSVILKANASKTPIKFEMTYTKF